ncbi:MAG TPA: Minf_1886 family protein [Planctomycetaceae bacterium]|nr:Minf_1886 family protein [Planctomycetaceae bacterium]
MSTTGKTSLPRLRYHLQAYQFVLTGLQYTQEKLGRTRAQGLEEDDAHISGQELCEGIRQFAQAQFGLMALSIFKEWGITSTADFGRIVFELVERGEMRKTERDQLSDFFDVYDFDVAFNRQYRIDLSHAFRSEK